MTPKGFTLLELMVTVAIVGILASVAMPWYGHYVLRGNRSDAISAMQTILDAQERYYADNVTYTLDFSDLGYAGASLTTNKGLYTISAQQCQNSGGANMAITQCVELLATAIGSQVADGNLIANTMGRQDRIRPDGTIAEWSGN